jgi:maltose O-acetyltransferase
MKSFLISILAYFYRVLETSYFKYTYSQYRTKYKIPRSFKFNGKAILLYGNGTLDIGENSYIGSYSSLQVSEGSTLEIGDNCSISHNVRIYTESNLSDGEWNVIGKRSYTGNVKIGDHVWIGANVLINPGVSIGDNSIVGANSVVTKDVETNTIAGGVPAKLIRHKKLDD